MGRKKKALSFQMKPLTKKQKAIVLPAMVIVGAVAVVVAIIAIIIMPTAANNSHRGVGADGFTAFVEKGTSLGADTIVKKSDVVAALGGLAKSVGDADVSKVFNYNGDRDQTVTYNFVRKDGNAASLYIDKMQFKSAQSMDDQHIFTETALARIIHGHSAYYMHAQTLGAMREYRVMVVNGLKAYKFVIDQPVDNITISEVSAVAALLNLAEKAQL